MVSKSPVRHKLLIYRIFLSKRSPRLRFWLWLLLWQRLFLLLGLGFQLGVGEEPAALRCRFRRPLRFHLLLLICPLPRLPHRLVCFRPPELVNSWLSKVNSSASTAPAGQLRLNPAGGSGNDEGER